MSHDISTATHQRDPNGMVALMEKYFEWMQIRNFSGQTIAHRRVTIGKFIGWATDRGITKPNEVTKPILERYQKFLLIYRKSNGDPLSLLGQIGRLVPLRSWFKWLARSNHIAANPASELELPRLGHRLPKHILTASEAEQVINRADVQEPLGLRDRAILETFYSTGIRRMELINLCPADVDAERGTIHVRRGKGNKDRFVPIGDRAAAWVDRYARQVRPRLLVGEVSQGRLFLTHLGKPFKTDQMSALVKKYIDAAELGKTGSCHLFRHTVATLMLENGADVRFVQAMLGHAELNTTAIYTQVSIRKLKEIHTATHPAKSTRDKADGTMPNDEDEE
ncbi:MAG: site-specific tyrosine recombinase XerC [Planctomycetes bacterium]|nr:site-specific tyrosine recombinase XerC [Planctomycetota bacterium]